MASKHARQVSPPAAQERIAVIAVGSDTVHLLVVERADKLSAPKTVLQHSLLLELGGEVAVEDRIAGPQHSALRETLLKYARLGRREAPRLVIAATEASRRASNGSEVLARLGAEVGEPIRILSGVREAQLGFLGACPQLKPTGCQLLIDSGGASTEVTITQGREYVAGVSVPVGAALLSMQLKGDPPSPLSWALSAVNVGTRLRDLPQAAPLRAWATGGSAHHLVGLESPGNRKSRALRITDLDSLTRQMLKRPAKAIAADRGQDPRRVRLLPVGALILGSLLSYYGLDACTVLVAGVREGIALAAWDDPTSWWEDRPIPGGGPEPGHEAPPAPGV